MSSRACTVSYCWSASLLALLAFSSSPALAQTNNPAGPRDATDVTKAEIRKVWDALDGSIDQQIKIIDIGGGNNVAVGVLERGATSTEGNTIRGLVHHKVTEIYYILEGSGTLVTGGTLEEARELAADNRAVVELVGPSLSGTSRGGRRRVVSAGDIVVIPAGVFHGFSRIDDHVTYLSLRVDPEHVLPTGYVHPLLQ